MFLKIDNWLFDKVFQPFADWFCDRTGRNPLWLAATCLYIWIACVLYDNLRFPNSGLWMAIDAFLIVAMGYTAISHDKNSAAPDHSGGFLNPYRKVYIFVILRMIFVITYPLDIINIFVTHPGQGVTHSDTVDLLRSTMLTLFLYFEACEIKPPAPPKKKEVRGSKLAHSTA